MRTQATGAPGVETYTEIIVVAFQNFAAQHSRMWSRHSGDLKKTLLLLLVTEWGCEATGKQKLPAHVTSFASAEGGCRIVGVTDFRQAPEAMNILL
jgi:hypothetical protein